MFHSDVKKITQLSSHLDALVLLAYEASEPSGPIADQPSEAAAYFSRLLSSGDLDCKKGKLNQFYHVPGIQAPNVLVVGAGVRDLFRPQDAYRCAAAAAKQLACKQREQVAFDFGDLGSDLARAAVIGAVNGCQGQDMMKSEKSLMAISHLGWMGIAEGDVRWGSVVGQSMMLVRSLVNLPPNLLYPESFARYAAEVSVTEGLELEVWDELRLRRENCGALLAVARGSCRPPRLLILRYRGTSDAPPVALVGKGVTFDSGGLSLKPTDGMLTMKCDMAGAATVLGAMQAIAGLKLPCPVVGLVGLVENMVSGSSYRLGDVLTARNGKTIEVHNTDAEGRLVLADVLDVARQEKPSGIIDLATLTGACVVALGTDIAGLMSNNELLSSNVRRAAARAGEEVWPLPMSEHFAEQIRGKVADLKNVGEGRWAGAITAAKFLQEFVGDTPWVHLDIAGPAFYDAPKPFQDGGGTGVMVQTLVNLVAEASLQTRSPME